MGRSMSVLILSTLLASCEALQIPMARVARGPQMMFGGGADKGGEGGGFMDKLKQAQQMFNPEMMKKYSEVGMKVQELQSELSQTEVECATKDSGVVVKVTGTQVPLSVTVSDELCGQGVDAVSTELTNALKQAHAKSGAYAQNKMRDLYEEMGLSAGMAGLGDKPPGQ